MSKLKALTFEERDKLKQYVKSLKEIKKEIAKMVNEANKREGIGSSSMKMQHSEE